MLIGIHSTSLFPKESAIRGDLMLMESQFGSGLLIQGAHPSIKLARGQLTAEAFNITRNVYRAVSGKCKRWMRQKAQVNYVSLNIQFPRGGRVRHWST